MGNVEDPAAKTVLVAVRFTPLERATIQAAADARGVTLSELIRSALFRAIDQAELPSTSAAGA